MRKMLDEMRLEDLTCPLLAPVTIRLEENENIEYSFPTAQEKPRASGSSLFKPFVPERSLFDPALPYHSDSVIVGSVSRRRYGGKWRALARATSASLTTRIPKAIHFTRETSRLASAPEGSFGDVDRDQLLIIRASSDVSCQGRVGVRANPNDRTYRRSGLEQRKSYELRGNRGSKLKQNLRFIFEGKSCSVSESRGNSISDLRAKGVSR